MNMSDTGLAAQPCQSGF